MDTITIIISLFVVFLPTLHFLRYYFQWRKHAELVDKLPGPKSYPIIGSTWELLVPREEIFEVFEERLKEFRPLFRTWMGHQAEIHIMKADHVETVLSSQRILDKGNLYSLLHPWLGKGLLTNTGASWHTRRKLLTPAFHFSILENFQAIFMEKSAILVNHRLKPLADGRVVDICPEITLCALDSICKTAMGVDMNAMVNSDSDYVSAVYEISEIITKRSLSVWLLPDVIFYNVSYGKRFKHCLNILHGFTKKVIQERKAALQMNETKAKSQDKDDEIIGKKKKVAFLDALLEASQNGANLSDEDIREEVDTFMFEGHDTTTASICWTLFLLGHNLKIQDKVADELQSIFGDEINRSITIQDLSEMKYLERVIKESLRLYPSVPFIVRQTTEFVNIGGYNIPPESSIVVHIRDLHRDPEYYPNPEIFNPDNFLPEVCKKRHPFAYVPFSAGPRNCIGQKFALMEEKTMLASILRRFKVKSIENPSEIKYYPELILKSQSGVKVALTPRT